jgi:hypothetical protein
VGDSHCRIRHVYRSRGHLGDQPEPAFVHVRRHELRLPDACQQCADNDGEAFTEAGRATAGAQLGRPDEWPQEA